MALSATEEYSAGFARDADGRLLVVNDVSGGGVGSGSAGYPTGAVPVTATSGNVAAASAVATLPGVAAKTTYITGFEITGAGATAASVVIATVTGTVSGSQSYVYAVPAGVTLAAPTLTVEFTTPIPASAVNTAIVVTLPSLGAGNTNAVTNARGFQL